MEKEFYVLSLSDLWQLGREGGATAHLDDGTEIKLLEKHGVKRSLGYVDGKRQEVSVITPYPEIFSQIRTIKRNNVLIARKVKQGKRKVCRLTGQGYHRVGQ